MFDIIIFAIVAAFIGYKLYKALGDTKYDNDIPDDAKKAYNEFKEMILKDIEQVKEEKLDESPIISEADLGLSEENQQAYTQAKQLLPQFTLASFLQGAKKAFETILQAYSEGDKGTLQHLVAPQLYTKLAQDIDLLAANSQKKTINVVGMQSVHVISIEVTEGQIQIKLRFESEQISNIVDIASGELMSGSLSKVISRVDTWTFARDINSKSSIWLLTDNE